MLAGKGPKGGCCQDEDSAPGKSWTSGTNTFNGTSTWNASTWSHHPKIKKIAHRKWEVTGHLAGPRTFRKWAMARNYAVAEVALEWTEGRCPNASVGMITSCNCTGACQPRRVWKADGF